MVFKDPGLDKQHLTPRSKVIGCLFHRHLIWANVLLLELQGLRR